VTPIVAAVGTTTPLASTGLLMDFTAIRALGGRPVAVIAGVSAQNAARVYARAAVDPVSIAAQFEVLTDVDVRAFCVGAMLGPGSVRAVVAGLARFPGVPVVCDPVIAASGGDRLADDFTVAALRELLFPHCTLLTPNLAEAGLLTGARLGDLASMHAAIPALLALGPDAVLLKGGHLPDEACDLLAAGGTVRELHGTHLPQGLRGTGSLLAAAIAVRLAFGDTLSVAVDAARAFVRDRITDGVSFGGMRVAY
jgi:hydroxymethylpyrimidine/phosphomethylpyrimidine kinase